MLTEFDRDWTSNLAVAATNNFVARTSRRCLSRSWTVARAILPLQYSMHPKLLLYCVVTNF